MLSTTEQRDSETWVPETITGLSLVLGFLLHEINQQQF
jgi:hypothetical protein